MHLRGIGTAKPPARYTKAQCLEAFERSAWFARLDSRSHMIARLVLQRDKRHRVAASRARLARRGLQHRPRYPGPALSRQRPGAGVRGRGEGAGRRPASRRRTSTPSSSAPAPAISVPGSAATSSSGSACAKTSRPTTWSARAAPPPCPTCSSAARCSRPGPRIMCSRSASRSAAPRCISTTTRAS
jgi:hypothetical protein